MNCVEMSSRVGEKSGATRNQHEVYSRNCQLVFELVDSVVPVKCNNGCPHCIILKNTEFMIDILMKERDELLKHVQN